MSVRLFICLVFITKIVASDYQITPQYGASPKYIHYNQRNIRKLVTESLNDSLGGAAESINKIANKANGTANSTTLVRLSKEQDENGTVTKKPEANKEGMETQSSQIVNSYPPYRSYQVTENVIDIPDDRTPAGPIDISYTPPPILNLIRPTNKTDTDKVTEAGNTKKNCLSILHINAEFDDKEHAQHGHKVVGLLKGIKAYIRNFRKSVVNCFHSFFHKNYDEHEHEHGDRFERAVENEGRGVSDAVQNVDKTNYNVHGRHVNLT